MQYGVGIRERPVDARNAVAEDDLRLFAHAAEDLAARQGRSDGVAVGPCVRGKNELLSSPYLIQDFFQHPLRSRL